MRRTFAQVPCQTWTLIGLKPMHRALVRRVIDSIVSQTVNKLRVEWRVFPASSLGSTNLQANAISSQSRDEPLYGIESAIDAANVVLVDQDYFCDVMLPTNSGNHRQTSWPPNQRVRLLWNWSRHCTTDDLWYSELGFAGLVYNVQILEHWAGVCIARVACDGSQSGSLTDGMTLPPI